MTTTQPSVERDETSYRKFYECPSWCERTDHDADVVDAGHPAHHYGPEWPMLSVDPDAGAVAVQAEGDWAYAVLDGLDSRLGHGQLRQLAHLCLEAAQWLEGRERTPALK